MSAERQAAYATIAAATYGGALPAGHRAWLEAQSDEMVIGIADRFHLTSAQYLAEIGAKGGKAKSKAYMVSAVVITLWANHFSPLRGCTYENLHAPLASPLQGRSASDKVQRGAAMPTLRA